MDPEAAKDREIFVESLRKFKTTDGYKAILDIMQQKKVQLLNHYLNGKLETLEDHVKLRAEFMAQFSIAAAIDGEIENYDIEIEQLLQKQRVQYDKEIETVNYQKRIHQEAAMRGNGW